MCHCGATDHTTIKGSAFDYPAGWARPESPIPGIPTRHGDALVCGLCPDHASELQGWSGMAFPSDEDIDWPADIKA